jgi:hypothetical protein
MTWFRRAHESVAPQQPEAEDTPATLLKAMWDLIGFINQNAGKLPVEAVVAARRVTDAVREVVDTADERPLDVHAVLSIKAILTDYLPTTLRSYLALDPALVDAPRPDGRTPRELLVEQINALWAAAADVLAATRARDVDALTTQGNFLRTKFTRSDLDL